MADPNWRTGGEDTFEESDAIKKLLKQIEELTRNFQENSKMTNQQTGQLYKLIQSEASKLRVEDDHFKKRQLNREQDRKVGLEKIIEGGKQVRLNKLLANSYKDQLATYDKVKSSLLSPKGFKRSITNVVDSLAHMTQTTKQLEKAEKALADAKKVSGGSTKTEQEAVDRLTELKKQQTFGNTHLDRLAKRFSKFADILEKHRGKILIGAGVASILIGIITKALNVAPLFQAMMKLMQFAFTMILMPIGTFFGAVIRPMVVGLVKKLAPQFGDWMKDAMTIGGYIGDFLSNLGSGIFDNLGKAIENLANLTGISGGIGETLAEFTENNPAAATVATVATTGAVGYAIAKTTGALLNRVMPNSMTWGRNSNAGINTTFKDSSSKTGFTKLEKIHNKGWSQMSKNFIKSFKGKGIITGLSLALLSMIPEAVAFQNNTIGEMKMAGMNQKERDMYEITQYAKGLTVDGRTIGVGDYSQENPHAHNTESLEELLGGVRPDLVQNTLKDPLHNGTGSFAKLDLLLSALNNGDGVRDVEASMESTGEMVELFKDITTKMALDDGYMISHDMIAVVNHFNMIEQWATDSEISARDTADIFNMANEKVRSKLAALLDESVGNPNSPAARAARKASNPSTGNNGINNRNNSTIDNFFGVNNAIVDASAAKVITPLAKKMADAAADAIKEFDKVNSSSYASIYGGEERPEDPSVTAYKERLAEITERQARTRDQMDRENNPEYYAGGGGMMNEYVGIGDDGTSQLLSDMTGGLLGGVAAANGFNGMVNKPTMFLAGEAGSEHVQVTPHGQGRGGGNVININIGKIEKNADFDQLKPMIQRWILEANSRRGMI